jgi:hypothetical protein
MKAWISIIGSSPFAVINTIWAACKLEEYIPEKVLFIVNRNLKEENIKAVHSWTEELLKSYGIKNPVFESREVEEDDFGQIEDTFRCNISRLKHEGLVAVDITPGRKYMSAIAMHCGLAEGASHVYYLHLKDFQYQDEPFPLIPIQKQQLIDMKETGTCCDIGEVGGRV